MYEIIYRKRGKVIAFPIYCGIIAQISLCVKESRPTGPKEKISFSLPVLQKRDSDAILMIWI
jgi:hypothetical protein